MESNSLLTWLRNEYGMFLAFRNFGVASRRGNLALGPSKRPKPSLNSDLYLFSRLCMGIFISAVAPVSSNELIPDNSNLKCCIHSLPNKERLPLGTTYYSGILFCSAPFNLTVTYATPFGVTTSPVYVFMRSAVFCTVTEFPNVW